MSANQDTTQLKPQWQLTEEYLDTLKSGWSASRAGFQGNPHYLDALKDALLVYDSLEAIKDELTKPVQELDGQLLQNIVGDASAGEQSLREFIIREMRCDPLYAVPMHTSCVKALKVFDVAELAEMIFFNLDTEDLISASQVNRLFAASISSSSKLQKRLYKQGDPDAHWSTYFEDRNDAGIDCHAPRIIADKGSAGVHAVVAATTSHDERMSQVPSQQLSMLICQPPVTEMYVMPTCCRDAFDNGWGDDDPLADADEFTGVVLLAGGITAGKLLDAAKQVAHDHRYCPHASVYLHDDPGVVHTSVEFKGVVSLHDDDPLLRPRTPSYSTDQHGGYHSEDWRDREPTELKQYIEAKREGKCTPRPLTSGCNE